MFERFTDSSRRVVVLAQEEARLQMHNYIGTEHLLVGLVHEENGLAAQVLEDMGLSLDSVRAQVEDRVGKGDEMPVGHVAFTPRAKKVLECALREALQLGVTYIGTEHILLGLIREGALLEGGQQGMGAQIVMDAAGSLAMARRAVIGRIVAEPALPLEFYCAKCGDRIEEPGALLFGPPNPASHVRKDHICRTCYVDITSTFKR